MIITTHVIRYGKSVAVETLSKNSRAKVDVKCPECDTVRNVHYSGICRSGHTVCQSCSVKKATARGIESGQRFNSLVAISAVRSGYTLFQCDCGNTKEIANYAVTSGRTKGCGCLRKSNKVEVDNSGENHPNWKGGISGDRERFMQTAIYKAWRLDVFERDAFACLKCSQVGGKLEAHHIDPYHSNESLRVAVTNGATLCAPCHALFHSVYGKIDFSRKDFNHFVQDQINANTIRR